MTAEDHSYAVSVAAAGIRADLRRVRLDLAGAKVGGAAARPVGFDDLAHVAGSHRPRRTHTEGSVSLGRQSVG
jgi:hypothetical protein